MKTWKQKIGKKLLAHVKETTQRCTLAEFLANRESRKAKGIICGECIQIEAKLAFRRQTT